MYTNCKSYSKLELHLIQFNPVYRFLYFIPDIYYCHVKFAQKMNTSFMLQWNKTLYWIHFGCSVFLFVYICRFSVSMQTIPDRWLKWRLSWWWHVLHLTSVSSVHVQSICLRDISNSSRFSNSNYSISYLALCTVQRVHRMTFDALATCYTPTHFAVHFTDCFWRKKYATKYNLLVLHNQEWVVRRTNN